MMERRMARGTSVTLSWVTFPGGSTTDETTGAKLGNAVAQSEVVTGFVHFAEDAKTEARMHQVLERGGCIVDLPVATVIEGREQLKFTINGVVYVQAKYGEEVMRHFDAVVEDVPLARTLLLRREV